MMNWNNLLDNAKKVADKAKAAAENLEGQLNESVGATPEALAAKNGVGSGMGMGIGIGGDNENGQQQGMGGSLFNSLGRGLIKSMSDDKEEEMNGDNDNDYGDDDGFFDDDGFYDDDDNFNVDMHDEAVQSNGDNKEGELTQAQEEVQVQVQVQPTGMGQMENKDVVEEEESTTFHDSTTASIQATNTSSTNGDEMEIGFESQIDNKDDMVKTETGTKGEEAHEETVDFDQGDDGHDVAAIVADDRHGEQSTVLEDVKKDSLPVTNDDVLIDNQLSNSDYNNIDENQSETDNNRMDNDSHQENEIKESDNNCDDTTTAEVVENDDKSVTSLHEEELYDDNSVVTDEQMEGVHDNGEIASNEVEMNHIVSDEVKEINDNGDINVANREAEINGESHNHSPDNNETVENEENTPVDYAVNNNERVDSVSAVAEESSLACTSMEEEMDVTKSDPHSAPHNGSITSIPRNDSDLSVYVSKDEIVKQNKEDNLAMEKLQFEIAQLKNLVIQREDQLASKAEQMFSMAETHEREKSFLESKVRETKDEAKKRIGKAKEKVESMQAKLASANARADSVGSSSNQQEEIIKALRKEGENLALQQSKMEELVRDARGELRDVKEDLENQTEAKDIALAKIGELQEELGRTKTELSSAREGENRADKLGSDLLTEREEREKKASKILSLEATIKEMKSKHAEKIKGMEVQMSEKLAAIQSERSTVGKEKDSLFRDLESKLRTSEREANLREDSLRHEVAELRKRWQESVRRCDALSMDLQQSSAPLMRQLESTERQSRARASAWAELESKLRSDLEENIVQNETLRKERYEMEANLKQLNRSLQSKESEQSIANSTITELNEALENTSAEYENALVELEKIKDEYSRFQSLAKENESKIRTDMVVSLQESEGRYNDRIESLEIDIRQEREKRSSLEEKIKGINASALLPRPENVAIKKAPKKRSLGGKDNQADILQNTLFGLGGVNESESESDVEEENSIDDGSKENGGATESFAFIEQLSQALKAATSERESLRKQLMESEEKRSTLENESVLNKDASERLPALEAELLELTQLIQEKDLELRGLREDIADVRQMYRSQLDVLLEEKATGQESSGVDSSNQSPSKATIPTEQVSRHSVVPKYGMMPSF